MEIFLEGNNPTYVADWAPFEEARYRARFYFDPNSIRVTTGDSMHLLHGMNFVGTVVARLELRASGESYQVRAGLIDDGMLYTNTPWVSISDASHSLELDWRAATGRGSGNGSLSFWVDGVLHGQVTEIDNDTRRVDFIRLGIVGGWRPEVGGAVYFDAFESRRQTYIGPVEGEGLRAEGAGTGPVEQGGSEPAPSEPSLSGIAEAFVPNAGQFHRDVEFAVHGLGGDTLFFTQHGVVLILPPAGPLDVDALPSEGEAAVAVAPLRPVLRLRFEGANRSPQIIGGEPLPGTVNYFLGNDPSSWRTDLPTYGAIVYEDLFPGIDLRYEAMQGALKGTFVLEAGADPRVIRWSYPGTRDVSTDSRTGDLEIDLVPAACETRGPGAECAVLDRSPIAWQEINGERISVSASYTVEAGGTIGLDLGAYDPTRTLIVDPILTYGTYLGGNAYEQANGIAIDPSGEILVAGITLSADFPTMDPIQPTIGGSYDAFVARLEADGSALIYSTYLGGTDHDEAGGIGVDAGGYAYVSGHTSSTNFPVANALQPGFAGNADAFIARLTPSGDTLVYSTYLGGSHTERNVEIDITEDGEATIVGTTWSTNFPTVNAYDPTLNGAPDAFISRLNAAGSALLFSTYFGGSSHDEAFGMAVDGSGNVALTGKTHSTDLPVLNAAQPTCTLPSPCYDVFVTMLSSSGSPLIFSTYLGGSAGEDGYGVAADDVGGVYVTGRTWSTDFPVQNAFQPTYMGGGSDSFIVQYAADGTRGFGTYLGGTGEEYGYDITVDGDRSMYAVGITSSTNFPIVNPFQPTYSGGDFDGYLIRLFPDGSSVAYSTYVGGNVRDDAMAVDVLGDTEAYVAGSTASTNFPVMNPLQGTYAGGFKDAFIVQITDTTPPHEESRTITYTYDPLYRLTAADYDDGTYFHYTYDPVGNRLAETTEAGSTAYVYDDANRLTSVGGVQYAWSDNGNLLSDGVITYSYNHANRLATAVQGGTNYVFSYSGLGDRLRQTVDETPTNYTLDLAGGLTQVLTGGATAYLYGNTRIGEEQPGGWQYHLGDALASVRQLADAAVSVTLTRTYEPFGGALRTAGTGSSTFGFAAEQEDGTGLVYLRARYYGPEIGRFLARDLWEGDPNQPMSYNAWAYVHENPVTFTDPAGLYGPEVHRDLTLGLVMQSSWHSALQALVDFNKLAALVVLGDVRVDSWDARLVLDSIVGCQICHFASHELALANINQAIDSRNPYLFGAALHQLQDFYSHGREGYGIPLGHAFDDFRGGKGTASRPFELLSDFYLGGHAYVTPSGQGWWDSPYPAHPSADVVADVRRRNPGINVGQLSSNDIIDDYLRRDPTDPHRDLRVEERSHFGLDTDFYVANFSREVAMTSEAARFVDEFLMALGDGCELDWRTPTDQEVRKFLVD